MVENCKHNTIQSMRNKSNKLRWAKRLGVGILICIGVLMPGREGWAHSDIETTTPTDGTVTNLVPEFIEIIFDEQVSLTNNAARIINSDGDSNELVLQTEKVLAGETQARWNIEQNLPKGWYAVTWSVIGADGHPATGSFTFYYGDPAQATTSARAETPSDPTKPFLLIGAILRGLSYMMVLLALGLFGATWAVSGPLTINTAPKLAMGLRRGSGITAGIGLVVTPLVLVNSAILLNGGTFTSLWLIIQIIVQSSYGSALLIRMSALFGLCTALLLASEPKTRKVGAGIGVLAGIGLTISFALAGHASAVPWKIVASVAMVCHIAAAAVWLGGIPGIIFVVRQKSKLTLNSICEIVSRFSKLASGSVFVVFIGGSVVAASMFKTPNEIWSTSYGITLLIKMLLVLLVGGMGVYNHYVLAPTIRREAGKQDPDGSQSISETASCEMLSAKGSRRLRGSLSVEALFLILIVIATALLTSNRAPAVAGDAGGFGHGHGGELALDLESTLARFEPQIYRTAFGAGEAQLEYLPSDNLDSFRFTVTDAIGTEQELTSVTATLMNETLGVGGIKRDFSKQPDGSWQLLTRDLGANGIWDVRVVIESPANMYRNADFRLVIVTQPGGGS